MWHRQGRSLNQDKYDLHARVEPWYDENIKCGSNSFSLEQVFRSWRGLLEKGIHPYEVICIGFGSGAISSFEYRFALTLRAEVFGTQGSGGSADDLIQDTLWDAVSGLYPIPANEASFKALMIPSLHELSVEALQ